MVAAPRYATGVVVIATVLFTVALFLTRYANVWLLTGSAGALSVVAVWLCCRPFVSPLLRPGMRHMLLGLLVGVGMVGATHLAYSAALALLPGLAEPVQRLYETLQTPPGPLRALPVLLLVVFAEELVWRGVLFSALQTRYGRLASTLIATGLYALPQLAEPVLLLFAIALGCGAIWTSQRALSGSTIPSLVTHLVWNVGIFLLVPVQTVAFAP
jgi:membrane protease YdiL (CAAX protease family)